MDKVTKINRIPENSIILKKFGKVDYSDTYRVRIRSDDPVDTIVTELFKTPKWVDNLMKFRDFLVRGFGLKTGDKQEITIKPYYPAGSKAVYFTVLDRNENEIVMAENDKHLNFRTSVMIEEDSPGSSVFLSTIVQYNNLFGRLYFIPVKPFHKIIIRSLLKRCANEYE
jgi:hypothetical protein